VVITPDLPDKFTDLRLQRWYEWSVSAGVSDMEIVSEICLYGVGAQLSASGSTHSWVNYKSAWTDLDYLQERQRQEREDYQSARISAPSLQPLFEPERRHPKGVHRQVNPDGKVKLRGVGGSGVGH
jgi:hypothetical protein